MADPDEMLMQFRRWLVEQPGPGSSVLRVLEGFGRAWSLTPAEQLTLLGLGSPEKLAALWQIPAAGSFATIIERLVIMLDIFRLIGTLLPAPGRAGQWMRASNHAPQFAGRSALDVMFARDLEGMNMVRSYLRGQLAGPYEKYRCTRSPTQAVLCASWISST